MKTRALFTLALILGSLSTTSLPAYSLPNQSIQRVIRWSQNHPHLPALTTVDKKTDDYPDYRSVTSFNKYSVTFEAWVNSKGIVTGTMIDARNYKDRNVTLQFNQKNALGLQLINRIYGQNVVRDFRNARYVNTKNGAKYYRGNKYGYLVWRENNSHSLQITSPDRFNQML